jgi:hypothetical protein
MVWAETFKELAHVFLRAERSGAALAFSAPVIGAIQEKR